MHVKYLENQQKQIPGNPETAWSPWTSNPKVLSNSAKTYAWYCRCDPHYQLTKSKGQISLFIPTTLCISFIFDHCRQGGLSSRWTSTGCKATASPLCTRDTNVLHNHPPSTSLCKTMTKVIFGKSDLL